MVSLKSPPHKTAAIAPVTKLVTFDIFDTLLTRLVCSPLSVFYFVGKTAFSEKILSCTPEYYVQVRQEAERLARIGEPGGEVKHERIFDFLIHLLGVSKTVGQQLLELELDWEHRLLTPLPGANELVLRHRIEDHTIAFVSDMYLSTDFLEQLLDKYGFWQEGDQLWVSSEHAGSKIDSSLFKKVLQSNRIEVASQVLHYGNNLEADYHGAVKAGITPKLYLKGNPNHFETLLEKHRENSGGITSLLAGAGRLLRLNHVNSSPKQAGISRIVGNLTGPAFTLYVMWILRIAKAEGIRKLYFVSRDGYVAYKIAEKLILKFSPDIEIAYIYGSRQAWHIAGVHQFDDVSDWLFEHSDGSTPASVLLRAGIEWDEFTKFHPSISENIKNPEAAILPEEMLFLKTLILSNTAIQDKILAQAKHRRLLLHEYLLQEGFDSGVKSGMVDIGWAGRTRKSFERAIGFENSKQLHWFYFGLRLDIEIPDPERIHYFLFGPSLNFKQIEALTTVGESLCLAPHGSVLGFKKHEGKVIPTFKEGIEDLYEKWGRAYYLAAVNEYCNYLPLALMDNLNGYDFRTPAYNLLVEFAERPTKEDAQIFGCFPFEHDQYGNTTYVLSPTSKLNLISIKEALIYGSLSKAAGGGQRGAWGAGSWALRGPRVYPLYIFAFIGYLRINGKNEVKRVVEETKIYLKKLLRINF